MTFYRKLEYYELMNWLAQHPLHAEVIMSIISKEHHMSQRVIEYTSTGFAKKYNLRLNQGRFDVRERFKFGERRDINCRGARISVPYKNQIIPSTPRQLHSSIFLTHAGCDEERSTSDTLSPIFILIDEYCGSLDRINLHSLHVVIRIHNQAGVKLGPVYQCILDDYEPIKNDLNVARELTPQKKDTRNIPRPSKCPLRPAAAWVKAPANCGIF